MKRSRSSSNDDRDASVRASSRASGTATARGSALRRIGYVSSRSLLQAASRLPKLPRRALLTHDLIVAYGLLSEMHIVKESTPARSSELAEFHASAYVSALRRAARRARTLQQEGGGGEEEEEEEEVVVVAEEQLGAQLDDESAVEDEDGLSDDEEDDEEDFGIEYDCASFPTLFRYCTEIAGASLTAANMLLSGECDVAINWTGGWHHATTDSAAGFCYVNDAVLCILRLLSRPRLCDAPRALEVRRVLYIDIDLHHGDGVQDAFVSSNRVLCLSLHKHARGFFPSSGDVDDVGIGTGTGFSVNVPLADGITDERYCALFDTVLDGVVARFRADAIVMQCGADALARDPFAAFNLTSQTYVHCVERVLALNLPTVLLGGGGYNETASACCWVRCTAAALQRPPLPSSIPASAQYLPLYGPDFLLESQTTVVTRKDCNTPERLNSIVERLTKTCKDFV